MCGANNIKMQLNIVQFRRTIDVQHTLIHHGNKHETKQAKCAARGISVMDDML